MEKIGVDPQNSLKCWSNNVESIEIMEYYEILWNAVVRYRETYCEINGENGVPVPAVNNELGAE